MPATFPMRLYEDFQNAAQHDMLEEPADLWVEFNAACITLAWRYRTCIEHSEGYKANYQKLSNIEDIFNTEKHLFGMYANCVSCVETMVYSIHALLGSTKTLGLPFSETKKRGASHPPGP